MEAVNERGEMEAVNGSGKVEAVKQKRCAGNCGPHSQKAVLFWWKKKRFYGTLENIT